MSARPSFRRIADREDAGRDDISVLQLASILLRQRRVVLLTPLVTAALVVAVSLILPRDYTATASFRPQAGEGRASELAGLASQFGITVPSSLTSDPSPQFYADLLTSREVLREAVLTDYEVTDGPSGPDGARVRGNLVSLLGVEEDTPRLAVSETIEELRERVGVSTDVETGVVEFSVATRWADLSRQVAERLVELVNRFNLERRRTRASAEREFIEGQVAEAEAALRATEDSLEGFLQHNRRYENSPRLLFEYERLQRRVSLRQQLFTSLAQSYQHAQIEEVRNTPVVTVVERPELPAEPDSRHLVVKTVLGLVLGGILGLLWAFGREILASSREVDPDHYAEFVRLRDDARDEVRRLWGRLSRLDSTGS